MKCSVVEKLSEEVSVVDKFLPGKKFLSFVELVKFTEIKFST